MEMIKTKNDVNGNKTLYFNQNGKRRRIQTNKNLPQTHKEGIGEWTEKEIKNYDKIVKENS